MNRVDRSHSLGAMRFGVGQPAARKEDAALTRGAGRYSDDVRLERQVHAAFLRSPHAHGLIRGVDVAPARAMEGVLLAYSGAEFAGFGYEGARCALPIESRDGKPLISPPRPALAIDRVRFAGEMLAFVVAETAEAARDAIEAIAFDIEPLPAVIDPEAALAGDAPRLFDEAPGNLVVDYHFGDAEKVAAAFAGAAHVTRLRLVDNRVVVNAMEPRAAIAEYDAASGRFTFHGQTQGVMGMRAGLAAAMRVAPERMRVLCGNVGGSFGMKIAVFGEYVCLLHAARELGRPVKWADARSESFLSDFHGRDMIFDGELALDSGGRFLALRLSGVGNMGGWVSPFGPLMPTFVVTRNANGMYRTPLIEIETKCVVTNTPPIAAYRGAGRPEANYFIERLIERAADETGIDSLELRRRNHVPPEAMPYSTAVGTVCDSGEFTALVDRAVADSDWSGFEARRRESAARGRLRGRGLGAWLEVTAPPTNEQGGIHFEADGAVTIRTGTFDFGQGHATPLAQILSDELGVPFEAIRLQQGDSDLLIAGGGTGGSKSLMASGSAIIEASQIVIARGRDAAAHVLEAAVSDIEFSRGRFTIAGTDRSIGIMDLARRLASGEAPEGAPKSLDVDHVFKAAPAAHPNGCHVAEVEIDPETGIVEVARYYMLNDFGVIVNPMLVEGQLHGGVVQGIGQALMELTVFGEDGQLVTGSFMDYAMPRASDAPADFVFASRPVPATTNPVGAKGCGEAGCAGSLPSVMNAVIDALKPYGVNDMDMPATPQKIWRAIERGKARGLHP